MKRGRARKIKRISFAVLLLLCVGLFAYFIFSLVPPVQKLLNRTGNTLVVPTVQINSLQDFEKALKAKNIEFDKLSAASTSGEFVAKLKDGPRVFFSQEKNVDFQVNTLQLIIQRLTIDKRTVISIDLRFDKPIVKW